MLREGGIIVYSTCTFSPEENEQTVEAFLDKYPDLQLISIPKQDGIQSGKPDWAMSQNNEIRKTARLWPHHVNGEGHFVVKFQKNAFTQSEKVNFASPNGSKAQLKDFQLFFDHTISGRQFENFYLFHQQLFALPGDCPSFKGLKVLRAGLHLGALKKNRFEPNHALAMFLKPEDVLHTYSLSSTEMDWLHYLKGETIATEKDRGWILITVDGFPLGWGKEAKGVIKNFYPKGLRIQGV